MCETMSQGLKGVAGPLRGMGGLTELGKAATRRWMELCPEESGEGVGGWIT